MNKILKGLYAIVDDQAHQDYGTHRLIEDIAKNSLIPIIQLRLKTSSVEEKKKLILKAQDLKKIRPFTLILNDDTDLFSSLNCDGLHLGQKDDPFYVVRKNYPHATLGLSCQTLEQAQQAQDWGATYIGCGAAFETQTKMGTKSLGLSGIQNIVESISIPVVAIGGIKKENLQDVMQTGCAMAAVASGLIENNQFIGQDLHELSTR